MTVFCAQVQVQEKILVLYEISSRKECCRMCFCQSSYFFCQHSSMHRYLKLFKPGGLKILGVSKFSKRNASLLIFRLQGGWSVASESRKCPGINGRKEGPIVGVIGKNSAPNLGVSRRYSAPLLVLVAGCMPHCWYSWYG